ncbi:hypothetical protein EU546_06835, partial [Candidatus Thorarchaeota archaeon]
MSLERNLVRYRELLCSVALLLLVSSTAIHGSNPRVEMIPRETMAVYSDYIEVAPFNITSDADFELQGWPGNGSVSNPYVISGINITSDDSTLIWVRNTRIHFVIEQCWFSSKYAGFSPEYSLLPVTIANSTNGRISDNDFVDSLAAISLYSSTGFEVSQNRFETYAQTVSVREVNDTRFSGNQFGIDHVDFGLWFSLCHNCSVISNTFNNVTSVGLEFSFCTSSFMINNTVYYLEDEIPDPEAPINLFRGADCTIEDNTVVGPSHGGIWAEGVGHTIVNNTVINCSYALQGRLESSTVSGNNLTDFRWCGIEFIQTNSSTISHNVLRASSKFGSAGISIWGGHNTSVSYSQVNHTSGGIVIQGSESLLVQSNTVADSRYGVWFTYETIRNNPDGLPTNTRILNNSLAGGGIHFALPSPWGAPFGNQTIVNNTLNGQPIGYFENLYDATIMGEGYGQLVLVNCSLFELGGGHFNDVYSDIEHFGYIDHGYASPITLIDCSNFTLHGIEVANNTIGIKIYGSTTGQIIDSYDSWNSWVGIVVSNSHSLHLLTSTFNRNEIAVMFSSVYDCAVDGCFFYWNNESISLMNAPSCNVTGGTLFDNEDGILVDNSDGAYLHDNHIHNTRRGILLNSSSDCLLTGNLIEYCSDVGLAVDSTSNRNSIYDNSFMNNELDVICEGTS